MYNDHLIYIIIMYIISLVFSNKHTKIQLELRFGRNFMRRASTHLILLWTLYARKEVYEKKKKM